MEEEEEEEEAAAAPHSHGTAAVGAFAHSPPRSRSPRSVLSALCAHALVSLTLGPSTAPHWPPRVT